MRSLLTIVMAGLVLGAAAGCPRFSTKMTYSLAIGDIRRIDIDAPASDQTVKVTVNSPTAVVTVYIVLEENAQAVTESLKVYKPPDPSLVLASAEVKQEGVVQANVPKRKAYSVMIVGADKPAEVIVTISGS